MFDEEEVQEGYSCECGGSITLYNDVWSCDKCDFEALDNRTTKNLVNPQSIRASNK